MSGEARAKSPYGAGVTTTKKRIKRVYPALGETARFWHPRFAAIRYCLKDVMQERRDLRDSLKSKHVGITVSENQLLVEPETLKWLFEQGCGQWPFVPNEAGPRLVETYYDLFHRFLFSQKEMSEEQFFGSAVILLARALHLPLPGGEALLHTAASCGLVELAQDAEWDGEGNPPTEKQLIAWGKNSQRWRKQIREYDEGQDHPRYRLYVYNPNLPGAEPISVQLIEAIVQNWTLRGADSALNGSVSGDDNSD